jgi:hypothetical protein
MKHLGKLFIGAAFLCTGSANLGYAGAIPYPNAGTQNPTLYNFKAATTGDLTAYFYGSGASFNEELGLLVNGVSQGGLGLDNQSTSFGASYDFGNVTVGDTLTFYIDVFTTSSLYYSNASLNSDGANHVYSTAFSGDGVIPAGTYVGFEDLADSVSDFNYADEQFVFTNTSTAISGVPESSTWAMMIVGFVGLTFAAKSARKSDGATLVAG